MSHQAAAVEWLKTKNGRGLLFMDAGTGKSFTALAYLQDALAPGERALILCPSALKGQWAREVQRFLGYEPTVIDGWKEKRSAAWASGNRIVISNYDLLDRDLPHVAAVPWAAIVADESHYLKSPTARRTKAFRRLTPRIRLALSGTPVPNALHEIWTTLDWLRPGVLGKNFWEFRARHCVMNPYIPSQIVGYRNEDGIWKTVRAMSFRAKKEEVLTDLKPLDSKTEIVRLRDDERAMYDQVLTEARLVVQGEERATMSNLLTQILRLRQLVDDPQAFGIGPEGSKRVALDRIVGESGGRKTIVFTEFRSVADALARSYGWPVIRGGQSAAVREEAVRRFKTEALGLICTSAGQHGLNLQEAERVIHYGVPWNWARTEQRTARAWRHGQDKTVEEVFLLADATIDTKMMRLIEKKKALAEKVTASDLAGLLDEPPF